MASAEPSRTSSRSWRATMTYCRAPSCRRSDRDCRSRFSSPSISSSSRVRWCAKSSMACTLACWIRDSATEPAASPANTAPVSRMDAQGSSLADWLIHATARNAPTVGMAIAPLTRGSSCAAAINGIRNSPLRNTFDVQSSGDAIAVSTERTDSTATSAPSISSATSLLVSTAGRDAGRSAHAHQQATTTTYTARAAAQISRWAFGGSASNVAPMKTTSTARSAHCRRMPRKADRWEVWGSCAAAVIDRVLTISGHRRLLSRQGVGKVYGAPPVPRS